MTKVTDYVVVMEIGAEALEKSVKKYLEKGYELHGDLIVNYNSDNLYQVLIKKEWRYD